jgi:hypothetical protein
MQQFYGMVGFSKALVVANRLSSLSSLRKAHGMKDISAFNSRIADLRLRIESAGTFQEINDVVAGLTRIRYTDSATRSQDIPLPCAQSVQLRDIEVSLQEILSRIPQLGRLYQMTFGVEPRTDLITLETAYQDDEGFRIRIDDSQLLESRDSLRQIVNRWRSRFPFLRNWRLSSAQHRWGNSTIYFRNMGNTDIDEFSETYLSFENGMFEELPVPGDQNLRFSLLEGFHSMGGGFTTGEIHAISPVSNHYLSEFSLHYLGMFLLSSLVRYRPQSWARAISRSSIPGEPVDDKALSLIERFLDLNESAIPEMVVRILNPLED